MNDWIDICTPSDQPPNVDLAARLGDTQIARDDGPLGRAVSPFPLKAAVMPGWARC